MPHHNGKALRFKTLLLRIVCEILKQNGFKHFTCYLSKRLNSLDIPQDHTNTTDRMSQSIKN